jgi:hypothetical protein
MKMNDRATNSRRDEEEPPAPPRLVAALREPSPRRVFVPPTIDEAILNAARRHLVRPPKARFGRFRSWLLWPAVSAACLALAGLVFLALKPASRAPYLARGDENQVRQVDILDAFQLARELRAGVKPARALDLNSDGVVDWRDVEIIAARAVKLDKGGHL